MWIFTSVYVCFLCHIIIFAGLKWMLCVHMSATVWWTSHSWKELCLFARWSIHALLWQRLIEPETTQPEIPLLVDKCHKVKGHVLSPCAVSSEGLIILNSLFSPEYIQSTLNNYKHKYSWGFTLKWPMWCMLYCGHCKNNVLTKAYKLTVWIRIYIFKMRTETVPSSGQ